MKTRMIGAVVCSVLVVLFSYNPAFSIEWNAAIPPASSESDRTVRLISDHTQILLFVLQADEEVLKRGKTQKIIGEFDLPQSVSIVHDSGYMKFKLIDKREDNNRSVYRYEIRIDNTNIAGKPKSRISTEWRLHQIFVKTSTNILNNEEIIRIRIIDGDYEKTFEWPLEIGALHTVKNRPKRTTIGLWDYNYHRATTAESADGVANFFYDVGINFTQKAGDETYRNALQKKGILTGGNTNHSKFYDSEHKNFNAKGKAPASFSDPLSIINLPEDANIPGVDELVKNAHEGDGIATFDFEPNGINGGFSDLSVKEFRKRYDINSADFSKFQDYVADKGTKTFLESEGNNPLIEGIWRKWTEYRSLTTSNYVQRIYNAVKSIDPNIQMAVTPTRPYGKDNLYTLMLGTDNAAMARYTDIIMPQLYTSNVKLAMEMAAGWKEELENQTAGTKLWPLLLIGYSGNPRGNSPQDVYQQAIGSIANGADGVMFYYPGYMDTPYWNAIAKLSEKLAVYEDFYLDGERIDKDFPLSKLPLSETQVNMYPGFKIPVANPTWSFTAHKKDGEVLLTLINIDDSEEMSFGINIKGAKVLTSENVKVSDNMDWIVSPGEVGFIVLNSANKE